LKVIAINHRKIPPGPKLNTLGAERVFGWRKVHA
jgi:hypothetical protein